MTAILAIPVLGVGVCVGSDRCISGATGEPASICGPKAIPCGDFVLAVSGELGGVWEDLRSASPATVRHLLDALGDGPGAEGLACQGDRVWSLYWDADGARWGACEVFGPLSAGSGGPFALGAYLGQPARRGWRDVETRVLRALRLTSRHIPGVGAPYNVIWSWI